MVPLVTATFSLPKDAFVPWDVEERSSETKGTLDLDRRSAHAVGMHDHGVGR